MKQYTRLWDLTHMIWWHAGISEGAASPDGCVSTITTSWRAVMCAFEACFAQLLYGAPLWVRLLLPFVRVRAVVDRHHCSSPGRNIKFTANTSRSLKRRGTYIGS